MTRAQKEVDYSSIRDPGLLPSLFSRTPSLDERTDCGSTLLRRGAQDCPAASSAPIYSHAPEGDLPFFLTSPWRSGLVAVRLGRAALGDRALRLLNPRPKKGETAALRDRITLIFEPCRTRALQAPLDRPRDLRWLAASFDITELHAETYFYRPRTSPSDSESGG